MEINNFKDVVKHIQEKKKGLFFDKLLGIFDLFFNKWVELREKNGYKVTIENVKDLVPKIGLGQIQFPTSFKLENPEEIAEYIIIPKGEKFPTDIKVSNLKELAKYIEVKEKIEIPKEFSIKNLKDIPKVEFPLNLKSLSLKKTEEILTNLAKEITSKKKSEVFISNKNPIEYIPVRIVDKKGKDWLEAFGSGILSFPTKMGILDSAGNQIDLATSEKQLPDNHQVSVSNFPIGQSTESKQDAEISLLGDIKTTQLSQFMTRIATKSDDAEITYVGQAFIGSSSALAVWKITRYDERIDEVAKFADRGLYTQIWDDKETLTYN